jgi:hypothetical protein
MFNLSAWLSNMCLLWYMFALLEKAEYIGRYDCKETNLQDWAADKKNEQMQRK